MELIINNENDAWVFLEKALKGELPEGSFELVFKDWPVVEFRIKGERFDSSLTAKVMEGFVELQKAVNRAYAKACYDKPSSAALTDDEKQALSLVVRVSQGSSIFQIDLQETAETFLKGLAGKMNGTQAVITIIGMSLTVGGVVGYKSYLENQRDLKQIETATFLSSQETERMKIFADAMEKQAILAYAKDDADEAFNTMLKGAKDADYFEIDGRKIEGTVIQDLVRSSRSRSNEVQLNGACRILKVDSSKPEGYTVEVRFEDQRTFSAKLEDKFVFRKEAHKKLIQEAEWEKKPIYLRMNGKELRGEITQATIIDVEAIPAR